MKHISDNLKRLREARNWSQTHLEQSSGISRAQISRLESEADSNPTISTLVALATALGVTVDELVFGEENNKNISYLVRAIDELKDEEKNTARQMLRGWLMVCQAERSREQ